MRGGVAAEAAVREGDRPDGRDSVGAHGTVGRSGGHDDDREHDPDQDESEQPDREMLAYHADPFAAERQWRSNGGRMPAVTRSATGAGTAQGR